MKKYRLITPALTNLGWIPAGTLSEYKDGKYSFVVTRTEDYQAGCSELRWVVPQDYINSSPRVFEELKEGACFSHEELREAFEAARKQCITSFSCSRSNPDNVSCNYTDQYPSFEDYMKSKAPLKNTI